MADIVQLMKKTYPSAVDTFMFKPTADIDLIMGKDAVAISLGTLEIKDEQLSFLGDITIRYTLPPDIVGEAFYSSGAYQPESAQVYLRRVNTPGSQCWMEIYDMSGSLPASLLAQSNMMNIIDLPTTATWVEFTFSSPPTFATSTLYTVAINANNAKTTEYIRAGIQFHATYTNGIMVQYSATGGYWAPKSNYDLAFILKGRSLL